MRRRSSSIASPLTFLTRVTEDKLVICNAGSTLQKAKSILDNIDGSNPSTMASDIKTVAAELSQYTYSNDAQAMNNDDLNALFQLQLALNIADKLNPENLSSQKVNQYLSVLNQPL